VLGERRDHPLVRIGEPARTLLASGWAVMPLRISGRRRAVPGRQAAGSILPFPAFIGYRR
jgi:hypothetical protein